MFSNWFRKKLPLLPGRHDSTFGDPVLRRARTFAKQGNWQELRRLLAASEQKPRRSAIVSTLAEEKATDDWVGAWLAAHEEADAWIVRGARGVARAWEIRSGAMAKDVAEDRWEPFLQALEEAEEDLFHSVQLSPDDHIPWEDLLSVSLGLGHPIDERVARFEEGRRRAPGSYVLHYRMLMCLTEKWGGSHDLMFDFARSISSRSETTDLPVLIPFAHVERWLYLGSWEKVQKPDNYFRKSSVMDEITKAWIATRPSDERAAIRAANYYSFCFWKAGDKAKARVEFEKTKGFVSSLPWLYAGRQAYDEARVACA